MRKAITFVTGLICLGTIAPGSPGAQNHAEGQKLYATYCSGCHGERGKGDGPAARSLPVKPADHTDGNVMNQFTDKYLQQIISKGGTGVGKSAFMPAWDAQLNEKQVRDIVAYMRSIADPPFKASPKKSSFFLAGPLDDWICEIKLGATNQSARNLNLRFILGGFYGDKDSSATRQGDSQAN